MAKITIQTDNRLSIEVQERASDGTWVSKGVKSLYKGDTAEVKFTAGVRLLFADREEPPAPAEEVVEETDKKRSSKEK